MTEGNILQKELSANVSGVFSVLRFTPQEMQVTAGVAQRYTNVQIAEQINATEATVKNYLHTIYGKTGLKNRHELAFWYQEIANGKQIVILKPKIKTHFDLLLNGPEILKKREVDVASLVAIGFSNGDIGKEMGIEEQSVKNYINSIFKKTNMTNRLELALWYVYHTYEKGGKTIECVRPVENSSPAPSAAPIL